MSTSSDKNFAPEEREQHKKEKRVHNSLGALLLGLGSNVGNQNDKSEGDSKDNNSNNQNSSNNRNSSYSDRPKNENRKRMMDTMDEPYSSSKEAFGWCAAAADMTGPSSSDAVDEQEQQEPYDNANKKPKLGEFAHEFEHWGETKKLDDDLDPEWLEHQHKDLDKKYGEGIIKVKYTEHGTLGYYCELCFAMMNAIKPLEMHCSGMKHLKKKDIYEKSKASGDTALHMERTKSQEPRRASSNSRGRSASSNSRGRSDYPTSSASRGRDDFEPPSRYSKEGNYDHDRYGREDYYDRYSRDNARDPYGRGGYGSHGGEYGRESGSHGGELERGSYRDYGHYERDPYSAGRDRYEGGDRYDPYADRLRREDLRGLPSDRPYSGHSYPDESRHAADRLPSHTSDQLLLKDERSPFGSDRPLSGDVLRRTADRSYSGSNSRRAVDYWDDRRHHSVEVPTPPPAKIPSPPPISSTPPDNSLACGPAAALLSKLAQCTVKNENDADLASNVINLLLKSLKEYNAKLGEKSVADLMEQAEIKLGTAKAIRTVRKPAAVANPLEAISLAMNTLRRANAENRF